MQQKFHPPLQPQGCVNKESSRYTISHSDQMRELPLPDVLFCFPSQMSCLFSCQT